MTNSTNWKATPIPSKRIINVRLPASRCNASKSQNTAQEVSNPSCNTMTQAASAAASKVMKKTPNTQPYQEAASTSASASSTAPPVQIL
ncbi:hypothetical protein Nepgr_023170 [Nepenthes gracilis]|uniref:Uncharacterized protein n=1 Tax=Nepenthes gracilis TaxID=150966 RepID=A0AAD3XXN1_NEPGR|nr:hypothetical protein Nepgr_023170 [Nepenthes gracilis]